VLALAWPVLCQQLLILFVGLSDRFLAGRLQPLPRLDQAHLISHQAMALGLLGNGLSSASWTSSLAAEIPWEMARQISARHVSYQAAQTTAIYLSWLITSYTVLVSVGGTALVARFVGAGDRKQAVRVTNQSIILASGLGLAGALAGLAGLNSFVSLLGLHGDAGAFAVEYLRPFMILLVFQVIESAGLACLAGAGDTRMSFWVLGSVALLNLPLAWGLFLGAGPLPELRFTGIAWGTAISHTLGGLAVLGVLARGRAGLHLAWRHLVPQLQLLGRLLRISVPAGVDSLSIMVGHLWFLNIVNNLGDTASSAHGIALGWEALSFLLGSAFGIAAMTLVGQNLGAGRADRAAHSGWVAFAFGGGIMCAMGAVFFIMAPQMFEFFCPHPEQRAVVAAGIPVLRLEAFAEPALATMIIFLSALRGAGDTRIPVLFSWIGLLGVRVPLAYLLTREYLYFGTTVAWPGNSKLFGAWLAMFADLYVRGAFYLYRFVSGKWQQVRV
jgi:putative MATE family efflux protein